MNDLINDLINYSACTVRPGGGWIPLPIPPLETGVGSPPVSLPSPAQAGQGRPGRGRAALEKLPRSSRIVKKLLYSRKKATNLDPPERSWNPESLTISLTILINCLIDDLINDALNESLNESFKRIVDSINRFNDSINRIVQRFWDPAPWRVSPRLTILGSEILA